jgi:hypothetical protein
MITFKHNTDSEIIIIKDNNNNNNTVTPKVNITKLHTTILEDLKECHLDYLEFTFNCSKTYMQLTNYVLRRCR